MNPKEPQMVRLEPFNVFETDGSTAYTEYRKEFSGRYDDTGNPTFKWCEIHTVAPVALPSLGQCFEGIWIPHEPGPYVIVDTLPLKLAFRSDAGLRRSSPDAQQDRPKRLLVEAVQLATPHHAGQTAWEVSEFIGDDCLETLTPELDCTPIHELDHQQFLRVLPEKALTFIQMEIRLVNAQRPDFLFREPQLSMESAVELARSDILGAEFREAMMAKAGVLGLIKVLGG